MLKAILHNKAKETFKINEDSLTSSVFQLLSYLPDGKMWDILWQAIGNKSLPKNVGALENIEYWSKWDADNTTNKHYVEPDIFLAFEQLHLIIEVKKEKDKQHSGQWKNELQAHLNEYIGLGKPIFLLALGGNSSLNIEIEYEQVVKASWTMLMNSIRSHYGDLLRKNTSVKGINGESMIYEDLFASFSFHGYFVGTWLEENDYAGYKINSSSILTLNNCPFN